jgi:hypothetical protein
MKMRQALASSSRDLPLAPKTTGYEPLIVIPEESKRHPGRLVAFIGRQVCFFEKNGQQPVAGEPVEVMITRPLYRRQENGYFDHSQLIALVVRPVTDDDILVDHKGFECSGSMCRTTATTMLDNRIVLLTPGRTDVWVAENVSPRFYGNELIERRPGKAWISRTKRNEGAARLEGLARIDDAIYAGVVRR